MFNPFSLEGKKIVITGASSGIGRQCAIECSKMGAKVVLIGRDVRKLTDTLSLMEHPEWHLTKSFDLNNSSEIGKFFSDIVTNFGELDGLVNCAGISKVIPLNMIKPEQLNTFFETNVYAGYLLTKEFSRKKNHNETGGSIVFISSVMSMVGEKAKSLYCSTKGAVNSLSRGLACELASKNIRVNTISPGVIITAINKDAESLVSTKES